MNEIINNSKLAINISSSSTLLVYGTLTNKSLFFSLGLLQYINK